MTKTCNLCRTAKPLTEFHRCGSSKDGHQHACKPCAIARAKDHYVRNCEDKKAYQRQWRLNNLEHHNAMKRSWRYLRQYGITVEDYDRMLAAQGGGCAICGGTDPQRNRKWFCVDHDHETGVVRGLLCMNCNDGLGRFADDPAQLRAAAAYLEQNNG